MARHPVTAARPDPWGFLREFTAARIALGRAGASLPTAVLLEFQLAHARARDAVHHALDVKSLCEQLTSGGWQPLPLHSAAAHRDAYIRRPDLGRILDEPSIATLRRQPVSAPEVVFVVADGLSALAAQRHALPVLETLRPLLAQAGWSVAPVCVISQGRVAIGDEIGALLGAAQAVVLLGERPGLSSPDSLGIYLTHQPVPGRSNAERNCISNVRPEGLPPAVAARKLWHLMSASRRLGLSGVALKEDALSLTSTDAARHPGVRPPI